MNNNFMNKVILVKLAKRNYYISVCIQRKGSSN